MRHLPDTNKLDKKDKIEGMEIGMRKTKKEKKKRGRERKERRKKR
jgi:hypothetical protein